MSVHRIPTDYETNRSTIHDWQIVEACWRLYAAGETVDEHSGVAPKTLAESVGYTRSAVQTNCRALIDAGVLTEMSTFDPYVYVSYAPTELVERERETGSEERLW